MKINIFKIFLMLVILYDYLKKKIRIIIVSIFYVFFFFLVIIFVKENVWGNVGVF